MIPDHLIDTEALRRLADQATPGPWEVSGSLVGVGRTKPNIGQTWGPRWRQDIKFICAARTAVPALLDALAAAEHRADKAEKVHRDLASALGFGDGITEPMADNETIIREVDQAVSDAKDLWELTQAACVEAGCDLLEDCHTHHPVLRAEAAEHRAARAEAQSAIRGRAVVMYRERARKAEAAAADIWEDGYDACAEDVNHSANWFSHTPNPYRASETA